MLRAGEKLSHGKDPLLSVLSSLLTARLRVLRVVTFNIKPGQVAREHLVPEGKLIFMERGGMDYIFEDTRVSLEPGKCFYRPPWTKASWTMSRTRSAVLTFCEFSCEPPEQGGLPPTLFPADSPKETLASMQRIREALRDEDASPGLALLAEGELKALLARLFTRAAAQGLEHDEESASPPQNQDAIQRALAWLERNFSRPNALRELYKNCGLSPNHFRKLFRAKCTTNPQAHLLALRLRAARYYLEESSLPVKQVADAVGIPNARLFARQYRRQWGQTPSESRNKHR